MVTFQDLVAVGFLVILEGLLSFDNALALAAMVAHLPKPDQKKALLYGMWGAFLFRFLSLSIITYLLQATWIKFVGGGYLIWMAMHHFFGNPESGNEPEIPGRPPLLSRFWKMVILVELTDITFSMDSILASVAVSHKLWVVFTGGVLGIIMMRAAASIFIRLIEVYPRLERSAYLLILTVGMKMVMEAIHLQGADFESTSSPTFWVFWLAMAASLGSGFTFKMTAAHQRALKEAL